jgi:cellulose synthase/poly-beta-1,6-N-acetylglucosamine synthase-like glycosyltransferase
MSSLPDALLALAAAPGLAGSAYLAALAVLARRGADRAAPLASPIVRFAIVVPAHDEEAGIAATVASLLAMDYPRDEFQVLVVADNCTDGTAARAREAGARVLERHDPSRRGKGYALGLAYETVLREGAVDAVVVVDADTLVSANLLRACAVRFARGAQALQVEYGVRNATSSWRTRLMVIAFALFHTVRSLARERLGLSCGLRGNGMAFSRDLLRAVPANAFSIVEDVEYGVALGLAGIRVEYVAEAEVLGEMPATGGAARSQRERWEGGRWALARRHVPALIRTAVGRRDPVPLDLALDLLVPPLTTLTAICLLGTLAAGAVWQRGLGHVAVVCWGAALAALMVYVARGVALSGLGARAVLDLGWAPVYAGWKVMVRARRLVTGARNDEWVRTLRNDIAGGEVDA